jgi:hypothetical protein
MRTTVVADLALVETRISESYRVLGQRTKGIPISWTGAQRVSPFPRSVLCHDRGKRLVRYAPDDRSIDLGEQSVNSGVVDIETLTEESRVNAISPGLEFDVTRHLI